MTSQILKQIKKPNDHCLFISSVLLTLGLLLFSGTARRHFAAGQSTAPTAPATGIASGNWVYVIQIGGLNVDATADLTQKGTEILGTVKSGMDKKGLEITEGMIRDSEIRFTLDRMLEQGTLRSKYSGKLDGDRIKGTIEVFWVNRDQKTTKVDWDARRVYEHPPK